ncbi:SCO2322 family protein [Streptomyces sp. NBRC 110028]|uniref:SCO2322 family protein n=1 Tax=Streptomyces sp. NBRC 110028 TaxID=1621260 RepID=UPI0006E39800
MAGRSAIRLLPVVLLPLVAVLAGAAPAQAEGYRYWSFWQRGGDGGWTYATRGPSAVRPGDGDMIGFRFAVSEDSQNASRPRGTARFGTVCDADAPAEGGTKRIAVVLDFGTGRDAPDGRTPPRSRTACARVGENATAGEALAAVAKPLRYNSSALLCAIAGYPRSGCGEPVASGKDTGGGDTGEGGGPSAGLMGGVAVVLGLAAAAVWQTRRRRT